MTIQTPIGSCFRRRRNDRLANCLSCQFAVGCLIGESPQTPIPVSLLVAVCGRFNGVRSGSGWVGVRVVLVPVWTYAIPSVCVCVGPVAAESSPSPPRLSPIRHVSANRVEAAAAAAPNRRQPSNRRTGSRLRHANPPGRLNGHGTPGRGSGARRACSGLRVLKTTGTPCKSLGESASR